MRKLKETVADVPFLMEEWDFEANSAQGLFPEKLGSQSNEPANWKCRYGHRWPAKINNRYNGRGCPECRKRLKTSFPEQALYFYVKQKFPDAVNAYKDIFTNGMELDVYIPSIKMGIEYDGVTCSLYQTFWQSLHVCLKTPRRLIPPMMFSSRSSLSACIFLVSILHLLCFFLYSTIISRCIRFYHNGACYARCAVCNYKSANLYRLCAKGSGFLRLHIECITACPEASYKTYHGGCSAY